MISLRVCLLPAAFVTLFSTVSLPAAESNLAQSLVEGSIRATITARSEQLLRTYELSSSAGLRDNRPPDKQVTFSETGDHARIRTGNLLFDGLYAMAVSEAVQNSVSQIKDGAYGNGEPIHLEAFQTGEFWTYVWTRDLSYSVQLALAGFDPDRAIQSLLFKSSTIKPSVVGGMRNQMVQDTGSGGSYPVSSDRIVWILGAAETLKYLSEPKRQEFLSKVYPILRDTIEQDRRVIFDPADGLYRGEQSFLDWREQTYPGWTKDNVIAIAMSKALSVNAAYHTALLAASDYAGRLNLREEHDRYAEWAKHLKLAINRNFWDRTSGLYSTYLLTDPADGVRVRRFDLLGESLAILSGVADEAKAKKILARYPTGPFGPPVVWPQEQTVPVYHNQAIWPFVTAYWTRAGRKAGNGAVVDAGIHSLVRGAAFNLSNMENFDFATGNAYVTNGALTGPVINSRRQLWSVAGYLSMVQDVVFGLETSSDGIRFLPFVTGSLRNQMFASTNVIELRNFAYQGRAIDVRVHLPSVGTKGNGECRIDGIELNGKAIGREFIAASLLQDQNQWDVYLGSPAAEGGDINLIEQVGNKRSVFGPLQPEWEDISHNGITVENGRLALHFRHGDRANVSFNIYRDGKLAAQGVRQTHWLDPESTDFDSKVHFYMIEAEDLQSGNVSQLSPTRFYATTNNQWIIPTKAMENRGGRLVDDHCFMDWGKAGDELSVKQFTATQSGRHSFRVEFSNGAGAVNTGITCGLKKLELLENDSGKLIAAGYLVMPQSGDWKRFDLSSAVPANLKAGKSYSLRIFEDEYSRNMSYLARNERYTSWQGGGDSVYNFVNIASIHVLRVAD